MKTTLDFLIIRYQGASSESLRDDYYDRIRRLLRPINSKVSHKIANNLNSVSADEVLQDIEIKLFQVVSGNQYQVSRPEGFLKYWNTCLRSLHLSLLRGEDNTRMGKGLAVDRRHPTLSLYAPPKGEYTDAPLIDAIEDSVTSQDMANTEFKTALTEISAKLSKRAATLLETLTADSDCFCKNDRLNCTIIRNKLGWAQKTILRSLAELRESPEVLSLLAKR